MEMLREQAFARKYSAKFKNISFEFSPDAKQIDNITFQGAKKISSGFYIKMVRKAVAITRKKMGDYLFKRFKAKIRGSNPITKELLKIIKIICNDIGTLDRYVKFKAEELFSVNVEFTIFSLEIFDMRTRDLRSKYYRRSGPVLVDRPYTGQQRRRAFQIKKVYINQQYRQKQTGNRFPGLGWIVEFGRHDSGWINPRSLDSDITPHVTPRIEGERKGKAVVNRNKKRRMLLIWDAQRGGYIFRPKAKYGTAKGKEAIYTQNKVIDKSVRDYVIRTMRETLRKLSGGGTWKVAY